MAPTMGKHDLDPIGPVVMPEPILWPMPTLAAAAPREGALHPDDLRAGVYQVLDTAGSFSPPPRPTSPATQAALARLVGLMRTLCTPGMGWPSDRPQTPENILPYVSEEIEELIDQLQQATHGPAIQPLWPIHSPLLNPGLGGDRPIPVTDHHLLANLFAACLWGVTASSYGAMGLLEGVAATVDLDAPTPWQGIRLVPCLCLASPAITWTLDVVTQAPITPTVGLPDTARITLTGNDLDPQPRTVQQWLVLLWDALEQHQPSLGTLRQGWDITLLLPSHDRCQGRLTLDLKLVGLSQPETDISAFVPAAPLLSGAAMRPDMPSEPPPPLHQLLQFTQPDWVIAFNNQVLSALPLSLPALDAVELPLVLATVAHDRMVRTQTPSLFSPALGLMPISLQYLWPRWRWLALQPDTPLISLMGGLSAACLSANQAWTAGLLQARLSLQLQQGSTHWHLDLNTGEWWDPEAEPLPGAVFRMPEGGPLATQVWPWEALKMHLVDALCQASPALRLLWAGTTVNLAANMAPVHDPTAVAMAPITIGLGLTITFQPQTR